MTMIKKTEEFLKQSFESSDYFKSQGSEKAYRLEHAYHVANIEKIIAQSEGFDVTEMVIAFDAYRIYEILQHINFKDMPLNEKRKKSLIPLNVWKNSAT